MPEDRKYQDLQDQMSRTRMEVRVLVAVIIKCEAGNLNFIVISLAAIHLRPIDQPARRLSSGHGTNPPVNNMCTLLYGPVMLPGQNIIAIII